MNTRFNIILLALALCISTFLFSPQTVVAGGTSKAALNMVELDCFTGFNCGRFAYIELTGNYRIVNLYLMDPDGTNRDLILSFDQHGTNFPSSLSFNPDSRRLMFVANSSSEYNLSIYTVNIDGTDFLNLTPNSAFNWDPVYSPDGSKIAFRSTRDSPYGTKVYVMNADGTDQHRITTDPIINSDLTYDDDGPPQFSPDGNWITFSSRRLSSGHEDIYLIGSDGLNLTALTDSPQHHYNFEPVFSPTGDKIAFLSERDTQAN